MENKKGKFLNITMLIINLIAIFLGIGLPLSEMLGVNSQKILSAIFLEDNAITNMLGFIQIISSALLLLANVIMLIINRKDKQIRFYYSLLIIPFLVLTIDNILISCSQNYEEPVFLYIGMLIIITALICIYNFKNQQGKKRIIIPILVCLCSILLPIILNNLYILDEYFNTEFRFFILEFSVYTSVMCGIFIVFFIACIIRKKEMPQITNAGVISFVLCFAFVIFGALGERASLTYSEKRADTIVSEIEDKVKNSSQNTLEAYIPVCKNNKWGYINEKGEEIIECQYDNASAFHKLKFQNSENGLYFAVVKLGNNYKIISTNNEIIANLGREVAKQEPSSNLLDQVSVRAFTIITRCRRCKQYGTTNI